MVWGTLLAGHRGAVLRTVTGKEEVISASAF